MLMLMLASALAATSCAPRYDAQSAKPDAQLSCDEIRTDISRAQSVKAEAQGNKGISGQNVAWALFFWPGIILNETNNSDVIRRADERIETLNRLAVAKNCPAPTPTAAK